MKAILIARVSTEEQKEAGNSLPAQVARLESYCQRLGFTIMKICSFDESAYSHQRTAFDAIIDLILSQNEKIAVCCDKVDRLSRNVFDKRIATLYEKALGDEVELHFVSDGQIINSRISAVEKFQFGISLGLAKYYSDAISDNVKRAIEQKLRKGEWPGKAPYGYKNIDLPNDKKSIIQDEYEAHIVRKVFEIYATGALSIEHVCAKIKNEHGISWRHTYLHKMLRNPFYHGIMIINQKEYPHCYPPIITESLFKEVQIARTRFKKQSSKYAGHNYMYRSMIRCGDCGLAITPEKQKGFVYYHCTQFKGKHNATWFREEKITEIIGEVFKQLQAPKEAAKEAFASLTELSQHKIEFQEQETKKLTQEQKTNAHMMDNLYLDRLKGRITESDYDRFYQKLKDEAADIAIRFEQIQEADQDYYITAKYVLELLTRAHDLFVSSEVEERRQLIKLVLSNLRIEGENLLYELNKPFDVVLNHAKSLFWRPQGDLNPCFRRERATS